MSADLIDLSSDNSASLSDDLEPETIANIAAWTSWFQEEHANYAHFPAQPDETTFSEIYHALVNSNALDTLLQLEHTSSIAVIEITKSREHAMEQLLVKQQKQMQNALNIQSSDQNINLLARDHTQEREAMDVRWDSEVSQLIDSQKREYREFVLNLHDEMLHEQMSTDMTHKKSPRHRESEAIEQAKARNEALSHILDSSSLTQAPLLPAETNRLQESFTINLGTQRKSTHNIRVLRCDPLDLCQQSTAFQPAGEPVTPLGPPRPTPERLQTAINLYSTRLSGMVLLVDGSLSLFSSPTEEFNRICSRSIDFHFPSLDRQLQSVLELVPVISEQRTPTPNYDTSPVKKPLPQTDSKSFHVGDTYITRHSNLSEIHVLFNLVTNDEVGSIDLPSRHPIISGLRNVLGIAFQHDVYVLSVPLLLVNQMQPDMTVNWCVKRAEMVLKCFKGFMLENSHLAAIYPRTIQFLVPAEVSKEMFEQFCAMIPTVFRVSNCMTIKS